MAEFKDRLIEALHYRKMTAAELSRLSNVNEGAISQYKKGAYKATQENLDRIATVLNVSIAWLMGADVPMNNKLMPPSITTNIVELPIMGNIAAGYDKFACEEWENGKVEIPLSFLKGHDVSEFFVLTVKGDSMFPMYQDGDLVIVKKQNSVDCSGDVGAVIYDSEFATLKKLEFVKGEDWLKLVPINPMYQSVTIEGSDLEQCCVIGVPFLLIRQGLSI